MANIDITAVATDTPATADIFNFIDVSEGATALNKATLAALQTLFAASTTETLTGTSTAKNLTPDALAALWEQGSNIASAGTISIGEGGKFHITGTTTITDIDFATDKAGRGVWLIFDGALTLTHHASTLILPTGASITTAAGDAGYFYSEGSDAVRCLLYQRKDGTALATTSASTTEVLTGTNTTKAVTADALAAIWEQGSNIASAGTISIGEGGHFNVTGTTTITDIDFATDKSGRVASLVFAGTLTLTHNASTLILPGATNHTTAAGDVYIFRSEGSDVVRCIGYIKAATSFVTQGGNIGAATGTSLAVTGDVTTSSGTIGYVAGSGGTVSQATSKSTGVTLNKSTGAITTHGAVLNGDTAVSFTLTNSKISVEDVLVINHMSGGTIGSYTFNAQCGGGSAVITIRNVTTGNLGEALTIQFVVIQGSNT